MLAIVAHAAKDVRVEQTEVSSTIGPKEIRVRVAAGGICGSDLHYYNHGGFGVVRLKEPMVLGHEISGIIEAVGSEVSRVKAGDRIAVSPSRPCNACQYCLEGKQNHCLDMRFYGSAMRFPHVQGAFREVLVCDESQAHPIADHVTLGEAAMSEPFAVGLHAVRRAGPMLGTKVLIAGCGPIGTLAIVAARQAGAVTIVATDVADRALEFARSVGATETINVATNADALDAYKVNKGVFDVMIEASGTEAALRTGLEVVRPGGVIVQLGLGGEIKLPMNAVVGKEIEMRGSFRFHEEFALAVALINQGLVDVKPLISATVPLAQAHEAFALAMDRSQSMKVQIAF